MGPQDQPPFFNAVATCLYHEEPRQLLAELQAIEQAMGRVTVRHWGERCIDLDIIQMGDQLIHEIDLVIPHPGIRERLFVVEPMIELLGGDHKVPGLDDLGTLRDELKHHSVSLCEDIDISGATVA
jgi:2-amino-4-hydroxy-6-hydroxymethyldihydropteridine diphosphokinase